MNLQNFFIALISKLIGKYSICKKVIKICNILQSDQNNDLDVTNYNGTYDSIFEKVENIKNKVKELKNTLRSLSTTLDKGFDAEK